MASLDGLRAALLDFDGTLVDLPVDWGSLRDQIAHVFGDYGITGEMRPLYPAVADAFIEMRSRGISAHVRASLRRRINRLLTNTELEALDRAEPLPGSHELLEGVRGEGLTVLIQTSNSIRVINAAWQRFGFPRIDAVVGRESARFTKPHPLGVRRELRRLGLRGEECVVIGDGDYDIELGRAIGAQTIRVRSRHLWKAPVAADAEVASLFEVLPMLTGRKELVGATA